MYVVFVIYDIRLLFANTFSLGCAHMNERIARTVWIKTVRFVLKIIKNFKF